MSEFVKLTQSGGKAAYVNMDTVEYITPAGSGAALTFLRVSWVGSDTLDVRESPDQIFAIANATRA